MSKILLQLFTVILVFSFTSFFLPVNTFAATECSFDYDPPKGSLNQNIGDLKITVTNTSKDLTPTLYWFQIKDPAGNIYNVNDITFGADTPAPLIIQHPPNGWPASWGHDKWNLGTYIITAMEKGKPPTPRNIVCQDTFEFKNAPAQSNCTSTIETKPIDPTTDVILSAQNINKGSYDIYINNEIKFSNNNFDPADPSTLSKNLGKFNGGIYTVVIGKNNRIECAPVCFTVGVLGSGEGGQCPVLPDITKQCVKPEDCSLAMGNLVPGCNDPQDPNDPTKLNPNPGIPTAIGCIHTNPPELVKDFLTFTIGIGGGLSFLMMLLGAFQMLTSAGNPETLSAGRSRVTSAIIGLLFVIFSILLLQIIGVSILNIPGFHQSQESRI